MTIASYRFPQVVSAIHDIASTRPSGFTDEPYLSAQVNASTSLPVDKDKNNHSFTWLIALATLLVADYGSSRLLALIRHQTQGML